jgi:hypothetical protein
VPSQMPAAVGAHTQVSLDALSKSRRKFLPAKTIQLVSYCFAAHD